MSQEPQSIHVRISPPAHALLRHACQERRHSQTEVVEAALLAFLSPTEGESKEELLLKKLTVIEDVMQALVEGFQGLLDLQIKQQKESVIPIATYAQMYGPIEAPTVDVPDPTLQLPPRQSSAWRRIATDGQIDGAIVPDPAPAVALPRLPAPCGWKRWFLREDAV